MLLPVKYPDSVFLLCDKLLSENTENDVELEL